LAKLERVVLKIWRGVMKAIDGLALRFEARVGRSVCATALGCLCLTSALTFGCSRGPAGPQGKVSGTVTYKGSPVISGATVSFISESGGGSAAGTVDGSGNYQLKSMNGDQIPAGKYKVMITPPAGATLSAEEAMKQSMAGDNKVKRPEGPKSEPTIPDQYRVITRTPLNFEVKAGDNSINIELEDKK
jgi:hypothetical protein